MQVRVRFKRKQIVVEFVRILQSRNNGMQGFQVMMVAYFLKIVYSIGSNAREWVQTFFLQRRGNSPPEKTLFFQVISIFFPFNGK